MVLQPGTSRDQCNHTLAHPEGASLFENVCVDGGTESPRTGTYDGHYVDAGTYRCACCGAPLFPASTQFDSGTGWPSYFAPVASSFSWTGEAIGYTKHQTAVEVHCDNCGAHLGHVFDDGEGETGYRYCINSVCLWYDAALQTVADMVVPWVPNSYLLMVLVIGGPGGACSLCCLLGPTVRTYCERSADKSAARTVTVIAGQFSAPIGSDAS